MELVDLLNKNVPEMTKWRYDIHKHPELPLHEQRTASKIAELLRSFGFDEVIEKAGYTGVVGILRKDKGKSIGLVAAIDCQEIQEENTLIEHRSINNNRMHAIGHDGEVAILLGAAKYLAETRNFKGTVVCIFYSSHSAGGGVRSMIEDGIFDKYPVDEVYGFKSEPKLPLGTVAVASGACMGGAAELLVKLTGVSSHVAFPNRGNNPILAAAAIVNSLESLAASVLDPANPLLVSVTSIISGNSFVRIPKEVELKGSVRFLDIKLEDWLPEHIDTSVRKIAESYNIKSMISYRLVCLPTINASSAARFVGITATKLFGAEKAMKTQPVTLLGSDISNLLQLKPGACISLGNGNSAEVMDSRYDFNDAVLPIGASLFVALAEGFLN